MKCYNHHERDAVGQCKHCCKGLCVECAADTGVGLACNGEHEKDVEFLHSLIENNKKAYSQSPKSILMSNLFFLIMGILFIAFGYEKSIFLMAFGIICVIYWVALAVYNSIYLKKIRTNYET